MTVVLILALAAYMSGIAAINDLRLPPERRLLLAPRCRSCRHGRRAHVHKALLSSHSTARRVAWCRLKRCLCPAFRPSPRSHR